MRLLLPIIVVVIACVVIGCTIVALNKAPVSITDTDNHSVKDSTNSKVFDTTISPK